MHFQVVLMTIIITAGKKEHEETKMLIATPPSTSFSTNNEAHSGAKINKKLYVVKPKALKLYYIFGMQIGGNRLQGSGLFA